MKASCKSEEKMILNQQQIARYYEWSRTYLLQDDGTILQPPHHDTYFAAALELATEAVTNTADVPLSSRNLIIESRAAATGC